MALCTAHFRQLQPGPTAAARPAGARRDLAQLSADAPRAGIGSRRVLTHIHHSDSMPAAVGRSSLTRRVPMTDNPHALPRGNSEEHAASRPRLEPSVHEQGLPQQAQAAQPEPSAELSGQMSALSTPSHAVEQIPRRLGIYRMQAGCSSRWGVRAGRRVGGGGGLRSLRVAGLTGSYRNAPSHRRISFDLRNL